MTNILLFLAVLGLSVCLFWIYSLLNKEIKRNRILQAFIAGTIRTISDYQSSTDRIDESKMPERTTQLPIPYQVVLENINWELNKDIFLDTTVPTFDWLECGNQPTKAI